MGLDGGEVLGGEGGGGGGCRKRGRGGDGQAEEGGRGVGRKCGVDMVGYLGGMGMGVVAWVSKGRAGTSSPIRHNQQSHSPLTERLEDGANARKPSHGSGHLAAHLDAWDPEPLLTSSQGMVLA